MTTTLIVKRKKTSARLSQKDDNNVHYYIQTMSIHEGIIRCQGDMLVLHHCSTIFLSKNYFGLVLSFLPESSRGELSDRRKLRLRAHIHTHISVFFTYRYGDCFTKSPYRWALESPSCFVYTHKYIFVFFSYRYWQRCFTKPLEVSCT